MTLVEIMLAVFILALAILPIVDILSHSTGMSKKERTEAAAANFAAKTMNRYMYEVPWGSLGNESGGQTLGSDTGIVFQWTVAVSDAWPVGTAMSVKRVAYHAPCGGTCATFEDIPRRAPDQINPTFCSRCGNQILRTITLTFQWKGPSDADYDNVRKIVLVGRRAMLDEANQ